MKNEKELSARLHTASRYSKTTTTAQKTGRMGIGARQADGRKGDRPQHTATRTAGHPATNFLRAKFLPLYAPDTQTPQDDKVGKGVVSSLTMLTAAMGLNPIDVSGMPYPYNVLMAHEKTRQQLQRTHRNLDLLIMESDNGQYALATMETASRRYDLYYIPVRPLFRLLRSKKNKRSARLLTAIFSYLYHVARVPGHRDEETFLYYHTDMISDWIADDIAWDDEENALLKADIERAKYEGDYVQKRIWHPYHLENFANTVANARPKTDLERKCLKLAAAYLELWQDYPQGNIFGNLQFSDRSTEDDEDNDDYGNTIYVQEYISFIHDCYGALYDNIYSNVQTEFNEKLRMQQHSVLTLYDGHVKAERENLGYITRFFELTDELCDILTNELK